MATYSEIREATLARTEETREFREDLARHPELAWKEHRTTEKIEAELASIGFSPVRGSRGTGVIAEVGPQDGQVIVLSADIDALKMPDKRNVEYRSRRKNAHHGCGHDVTTAGLVGAAHVLKGLDDRGELANRVRFVFRPAEEDGKGAAVMVREDAVLEHAVAAYGLHCWPTIRIGQYGVRQGPTQYSTHRVELELTGPGGHTARPEESENPVEVGADLIVGMRNGLRKLYANVPEGDRPVLAFGSFNAGTTMNVIPDHGEGLATLRSPTMKTYQAAPQELMKIAAKVLRKNGYAGAKVSLIDLLPPVINTAEPEVRAILGAVVGEENVVRFDGSRGGDDFSFFGAGVPKEKGREAIPGVDMIHYTQLGVVPMGMPLVDSRRKLHTPTFDTDRRAPVMAAVQFAALGATPVRPRERIGERALLLAR
ncbi:M20 metallopeptidase family protein [Uniformispora flossi]|uniref:M20 metallopeptidase family protein n=1 Tax=Uniformispora flossi TaxID=3390723 RepID=UPI003C2F3D9A